MDHITTDDTFTYAQWVSEQTKRIPSLSTVSDFFERDSLRPAPNDCTIVCHLVSSDPSAKSPVPLIYPLNAANLQNFLTTPEKMNPRPDCTIAGRILTIEDPSKDVVEILGRTLDIDPLFFGGHIETACVDIARSRTSMATLPSNAAKQDFINITYHKVVVIPDSGPDKPPVLCTGIFLRSTNVPRKLSILPENKKCWVGLVKQCCSILKIKSKAKNGPWLVIVLVDAAIKPSEKYIDEKKTTWDLTPSLFQGGFADYDDTPRYSTRNSNNPSTKLNRNSMLDAVSLYWEKGYPPTFNTANPTLLSLCYHPLKIVASEWMTYLEVMFHAIKKYEYSPDKLREKDSIQKEVQTMHGDLKSVQAWSRRSEQSSAKVKVVTDFLESLNHSAVVSDEIEPANSLASCSADKSPVALDREIKSELLMDFRHIAGKITVYGRALEHSVTIVTSLIQIADSRLSFAETLNINRLTNIALIFVPLSYVSSLFAIPDKVMPNGKVIWMYITVASPILFIVLFLSWKSQLAKWLNKKFPKCLEEFNRFPKKVTELSRKFTNWRKKNGHKSSNQGNSMVSDAPSMQTTNQKQVDIIVP